MSFYGKYRGLVINNMDPMLIGRVQVTCPAVLGEGTLSWAMPCAAFAGIAEGLFAVPSVGASVWVEFEGGNPDFPIYTGGFWGEGESPAIPPGPTTTVLARLGVSITINSLPGAGGLTILVGPPVVATPMTLMFNAAGITLTNGASSISLSPAAVTINEGALEII
jgi:type VI secretion system (T6SS) baseplate-like injector VgrG